MNYRPEIDGLRAVAVLPVILFHAGFEVFSGGFVGVDVFFVISGYLITSILISELEQGRFSILRFYERRARRILPALFFVMLVSLPFAWLWLLPSLLKDFAQSLVAVVFFASNILFWREEDYFAPAAELKPLLHTWSLAVEEQFYLLFPLVLWVLWRLGRRRAFWSIALLAGVSLALSEWGWRHASVENFYLAPFRAWELLAGALCAFLIGREFRWRNGGLAMAGLALIVLSIFFYDDTTPFPSLWALAPVLGAALVILFAGPRTLAARVLSLPPMVGVGLISYSLYLWHQPVLALARARIIGEPAHAVMAALVLLSLGLAYLTWRFVEQPFRHRSGPKAVSRRNIFLASGIGMLFFAVLGLLGHVQQGFPGRDSRLAALDARMSVNTGLHADCEDAFTLSPQCTTAPPGGEAEMVLWGDSFAMHLAQGLVAPDDGAGLRQHTKSSCAPVPGLSLINLKHNRDWALGCMAFNDRVLDWLTSSQGPRYVVLSSTFGMLSEDIMTRNGDLVAAEDRQQAVREALLAAVGRIRAAGVKVVIVSPMPKSWADVGQCLVRAQFFSSPESGCDFASTARSNGQAFAFLESMLPDVPVIWLDEMVCPEGRCTAARGGVLLYRDSGHLAREGSAYLGQAYDWAALVRARAR